MRSDSLHLRAREQSEVIAGIVRIMPAQCAARGADGKTVTVQEAQAGNPSPAGIGWLYRVLHGSLDAGPLGASVSRLDGRELLCQVRRQVAV